MIATPSKSLAQSKKIAFDDSFDKLTALNLAFEQHHIAYNKLSSFISIRTPVLFYSQLDPDNYLLFQDDYDRLNNNFTPNTLLTEDSLKWYLSFTKELLLSRLEGKISYLSLLKEVNFSEPDSLLIKFTFVPDPADNKKESDRNYLRQLKYDTYARMDSADLSQSKELKQERLNEYLKRAVQLELCKLETQIAELDVLIENSFLSSFARSFDPHSDYFSLESSKAYLDGLSSDQVNPGLTYSEDGNQFYISNIHPFSKVADYSEVKLGDEITAVEFNGEMLPPLCISPEQLYSLFYTEPGGIIRLEVFNKESRKFIELELKKELYASYDNHIYSFLIRFEGKKYAYINLPSFYAEFGNGTKSSSQDLAILLLKLQGENIDGLLFDLRNNGGGSINEAIDLASSYINYGPLFITEEPGFKEGRLYKDTRKGQLFRKKTIFIVNGSSASASEILANTVKNYKNMLVVGDTTFGKSTGQNLLELYLNPYSKVKQPFGVAKITTLKIYDLHGDSHQGNGVAPDIFIPQFPSHALISENSLPYRMKFSKTSRSFKSFFPRTVAIDSLSRFMNDRVAMDSLFQIKINKNNSFEQALNEGFYYSLGLDDYNTWDEYRMDESERKEGIEVELFEDNEQFKNIGQSYIPYVTTDKTLELSVLLFKKWNEIDDE